MSLFQKNILIQNIKTLDGDLVNKKWDLFQARFLNLSVQKNIEKSKEEQYQEGFLRDLFVSILGYTLNPDTNFNLTTEYKNVKDSKKADGAIVINNKVKAVIELKGTNIVDLNKIEEQAFSYKNNQPDATYVITSNFKKLRLYIDNAVEYIEFNLFELTKNLFQEMYLCLSYDSLKQDLPKKLKTVSLTKEKNITNELYRDYSLFKKELFQNLINLNPEYKPLELFKKSQKLLDRFLFLFFAEDRYLLQPNSVRTIINHWKTLKELDAYIPLIDRFRQYFGYLNTGYTNKDLTVYAYNGGLFAHDEILDTVKIDDEILHKHTKKLSDYDFNSEIDVNILGHIFENSLNEIDEVKAQLEDSPLNKSQTKRKKDGVFYTPEYITQYIVENTIGKLCTEKKQELQINEEEYAEEKNRTKNKKTPLSIAGKKLLEKLTLYRNWLLQMTICDPACGSGAFLNEALDFLIKEHLYIDELQAKLFNDSLILSDVETSILENNLYGVDLNEESIEIAKLSLWLRTAKPHRKLNNLNHNLKCGNSLIDDTAIAGNKAFNWNNEFPEVFEKGGFDVIIGNPPYVNIELLSKKDKLFLYSNYRSAIGRTDLYVLFIEKCLQNLKDKGTLGLIIPYAFTKQNYGKNIREIIINNHQLISIIDTTDYFVFSDAIVKTIVLIIGKTKNYNNTKIYKSYYPEYLEGSCHEINQNNFLKLKNYIFETKPFLSFLFLKDKIEKKKIKLEDICLIAYGIRVNNKNDKNKLKSYYIHDTFQDGFKRFIEGKNIERYIFSQNGWLNYRPEEHYNAMFTELFENEKLMFINVISERIRFSYDSEKYYNSHTVINVVKISDLKKSKHITARKIIRDKNINLSSKFDLKYILTIVNSKIINWYFHNFLSEGLHFYPDDAKQLPIKKISIKAQQPFIKKADQMLNLNKELQEVNQKFTRTLEREFSLIELSKKLNSWCTLSYADFLKELKKKKTELSLNQKAEWEEYFNAEKQKAQQLQEQIEQTDKEIDQMVYQLYELTPEEIELIENEIKN